MSEILEFTLAFFCGAFVAAIYAHRRHRQGWCKVKMSEGGVTTTYEGPASGLTGVIELHREMVRIVPDLTSTP